MEEEEAFRLLWGGLDGIAEWNRRRKDREEIPDLSRAYLCDAHLIDANLSGAKLNDANLFRADLYGANLYKADLSRAQLGEANLKAANLSHANLTGALLDRADLSRAELGGADLGQAYLSHADLFQAQLFMANLRGAHLNDANLGLANLSQANLRGADLGGADLGHANLTDASLVGTVMINTDLSGAKLSDCRIFGISVWNVKTDDQTEQKNLVLTKSFDPVLTVDNLKIAQFIHLLLNNDEIRGVIDSITSKVVLILGRFAPERKPILDALREHLRLHDYLPVMFDFDKPSARGYTETITTLARMARFIVADLTDATEVRLELAKIVPDLPSVPVQPLVLASVTEYVTFDDLRRYPWVLKPFRYTNLDHAITSLQEMVLTPAEAKVVEQRR
jgi:uncharacterized protein YjbI with pentapeptide repeats